jgi:predicted nucleic acid-binding protein
MIYLDTSVLLAHILAEDRQPPAALWSETLVASRLLEYEVWVRVHARGLASSHAEITERCLAGIAFLELTDEALARAREPFATPIRTLDALHLSSAVYLREVGTPISLATYDDRLAHAARSLDFDLYPLT